MHKYNVNLMRASSQVQLQEILELQEANLPKHMSSDQMRIEGFVTVTHSIEILDRMNKAEAHVIALSGEKVIAYALSMHKSFWNSIPVLMPMFNKINELKYDGKALRDSNYIVMGQICIHEKYRKTGLFRELYNYMANQLKLKYDYLITEVDIKNQRSLSAHKHFGFIPIHRYVAAGTEWDILLYKFVK